MLGTFCERFGGLSLTWDMSRGVGSTNVMS